MSRVAAFLSIAFLLVAPGASARDSFEDKTYWYLIGGHYAWRQFDDGTQIVKDVGETVGIGAFGEYQVADDTPLIGRLRGEVFGGRGNYDVGTGSASKTSSNSTHFGLRTEGDLGWRFLLSDGKVAILPFGGIGYRWWKRNVEGTPAFQAFDESWHDIYTKAGARAQYSFERDVALFAEAGTILPVITRVSGGSSGSKGSFKPGMRVSTFAEAGVHYKGLRPSIYYEGSRFSADESGAVGFPRTEGDVFGLRVAFEF